VEAISYLTDPRNMAASAAMARTIGNYLLGQKRRGGGLPPLFHKLTGLRFRPFLTGG
jgi:hypothetical protein